MLKLAKYLQRRTYKQFPGLSHLSCQERVETMKLALQYRKYRGNMIETYKISHGLYYEHANCDFLDFRLNHSRH